MSTFAVTLERIASVSPIPDADRIEMATLEGMDFTFVIGKDSFKPGDRVVYFPVDSLLPEALAETLGLKGKLAGKDQNRVKTIRLRGIMSQGVVADPSILGELPAPLETLVTVGVNLAFLLGVTKYDPPENIVSDGVLLPLPDGQSMYDIESADRYIDIAAGMMDEPVFITEKVEGSNFWFRLEPDGTVLVGQRNNRIEPLEGVEHTFHRLAGGADPLGLAKSLGIVGKPVTIYAEALGPKIQGNYYGFKAHTLRIFDIKVGFDFLAPAVFLAAVREFYGAAWADMVVPVLVYPEEGITLRKWLAGRTIKGASDGKSLLVNRLREGIVIKPLTEARNPSIGRRILKQRSPAYLSKSDL